MDFFNNVERNDARLSHLRTALAQLPDSIPLGNSKYNFEHYATDPDKVELYGSTEAALNNALEVTFAPRGRKDESAPCSFEFQERGPGLVAVVNVLAAALDQFPNSALLQKWVSNNLQVVATDLQDVNSDSEDDWLEEIETQRSNMIQCTGLVIREYLLVTRTLVLMFLNCWICCQRSRWKGQAGRLNNRILQFQCLREGLYIQWAFAL